MAANIGTATVDVTLTGAALRLRALELAVEVSKYSSMENSVQTAQAFADFLDSK